MMADEKQICDPLDGERHRALAERIGMTFEASPRRGASPKLPINKLHRSTSSTRMPQVASYGLLVLLCAAAASRPTSAQFLFTYEINQESDDSRAPKSSLFDPSSFKIVTPSQLQSSYQKLAAQPPEQAPLAPPIAGATEPSSEPAVSALPANSPASSSFLKQTSAAIQSFAELFNLSPSSSPAPLGSQASGAAPQGPPEQAAPIDTQAEARSLHEHWTQQQQRAHSAQQLQHNQLNAEHLPALHSFTTAPSVAASPTQDQIHSRQQQQAPTQNSSPASYWLTSSPLSSGAEGNFLVKIKTSEQQQQQQPQAQRPGQQSAGSLVESLFSLGQSQQQAARSQPLVQQQPTAPHFGLPAPRAGAPPATSTQSSRAAPAQSSFLSTPSSYFTHAAPTPATSSIQQTQTQSAVVHPQNQPQPALNVQNSFRPHRAQQVAPSSVAIQNQNQQPQQRPPTATFQPQSLPLHQHQSRSLLQQPAPRASSFAPDNNLLEAGQLRPPANSPREQSFALNEGRQQPQQQAPFRPLKSAEESLLAFRRQQQSQHDQQAAVMAAQQQLAAQQSGNSQQASNSRPAESSRVPSVALGASDEPLELAEQPNYTIAPAPAPTQRPAATQAQLGEIPKVSPQIYESFLLQQKDQYEKHMELLKQQQELNKLLEQKQREEAEKAKRKDIQRNSAAISKKEELERVEQRKKAAARAEQERELQAARKARQEAEEARRKQLRAKQEEEEKLRRAAEEERRYREYLEARRKQEAEEAAAAAAELKRQRELQEQREREARERAELERRRKLEAEEAERREREQYRNYLRHQEELKRLLELKQREDEAARRRQAAAAATAALATTTTSSTTPLPLDSAEVSRDSQGRILVSAQANRLAQQHKERARQLSRPQASASQQSSGWGAPIRASRTRTSIESTSGQSLASATTPSLSSAAEPSTTGFVAPVSQPTASPASADSISASRAPLSRISQAHSERQQPVRKLKADEKLIRQKIPNYTGAGKYGLYRSGNSSDTFAELVALLESVTLPSSTTTSTTSTTPAPLASSSPDDLEPAEAPLSAGEQRARLAAERMASSLSPLLNARDLYVTPAPFPASTGEPLGSTTIFDDDVPRRPVRNQSQRQQTRGSQQQVAAASQNWPTSVSGAGLRETGSGSSATTRSPPPQLTRRSGSPIPGGNSSRTASIGLASLPPDSDNDGIPGRAGIEYPVLGTVPATSFSCAKQPLNGYYADTETACQVVHLCQGGEQSSILCPNGTIFNQEKFSCQWWYEVNCSRAPMFYQLNDNLYKSSLKAGSEDPAGDADDQAKATTTSGAVAAKDLVTANKRAQSAGDKHK